jgi:hypothetical protein
MIKKLKTKQILTEEQCKNYAALCLSKVKQIETLEPDSDWIDSKELLASRHSNYNIFSDPDFFSLKEVIRKHLPSEYVNSGYYIKGWINLLEAFQDLPPHTHPYELSGHVMLQADKAKTNYIQRGKVINIPPVIGMLSMIPKAMIHWVGENISATKRISIAFDLIGDYEADEEKDIGILERI